MKRTMEMPEGFPYSKKTQGASQTAGAAVSSAGSASAAAGSSW